MELQVRPILISETNSTTHKCLAEIFSAHHFFSYFFSSTHCSLGLQMCNWSVGIFFLSLVVCLKSLNWRITTNRRWILNLMSLVSSSRQEVTHARYIPRVFEHFHHIMLKDRIAWALGYLVQLICWVLFWRVHVSFNRFWVENGFGVFLTTSNAQSWMYLPQTKSRKFLDEN